MAKKKEKAELVAKEETHPLSPFEEMDNYFDRFFQHPFSLMSRPWWPAPAFPKMDEISTSVDIFEEGNEVVVKAEIPGMKKEDINISFTENLMTISGEKKKVEKVEKKNYHRIERSYGSFRRSFRLPENVDGDKAKASFKRGVLEIRLPKTKESKKQKKITID